MYTDSISFPYIYCFVLKVYCITTVDDFLYKLIVRLLHLCCHCVVISGVSKYINGLGFTLCCKTELNTSITYIYYHRVPLF